MVVPQVKALFVKAKQSIKLLPAAAENHAGEAANHVNHISADIVNHEATAIPAKTTSCIWKVSAELGKPASRVISKSCSRPNHVGKEIRNTAKPLRANPQGNLMSS